MKSEKNKNQYGLSRAINSETKRTVRQRCGFGCVNCGCAIYQYEHVEPTFAEAISHDPDNIVLLCGGCHDRVSRGVLSKETIKLKSKNPKCLELGFSRGPFDLGVVEPEIIFGTLKCRSVRVLLRILGEDVLSIITPESEGLPFLINATLRNKDGVEVFRIEDNEWVTNIENWDVEVVGKNITIRKKLGDVVLSLRSEPPTRLVIEKLAMSHRGTNIVATENKNLAITTASGLHLDAGGVVVIGSQIGVDVLDNSVSFGVGGGGVIIESMSHHQLPHRQIFSDVVTGLGRELPPFPLKKTIHL